MTMPDFTAREAVGLSFLEHAYPNIFWLLSVIVDEWPEHEPYLVKSMRARSDSMLASNEPVAKAILKLWGKNGRMYAADYRWLCAVVREEELLFARCGHYRYSTFEDTNANVYSDKTFMTRYMNGLLCAQILWYMHGASLRFFCQRLAALTKPGGKVLEVGPGHGLLLYLALQDLRMSEAVAWDLSEVSLEQTRHALGVLGALDRARFAVQDMHLAEMLDERFDLVILSHLLEHLEAPVEALRKLRHVISDSGLIFVNVPLNAPMPDHLILLQEPGEAERMLTDGGFRVIEMSVHTTDGMSLIKALKMKTAATCSIIAKPA